MNACERYEEMISALLDDELDAEAEAELRAHMAECDHCSEMYRAFSAVGEALREQDVPDTLHDAIMTKVHAAEKAGRTQRTIVRLRPILAAAACLIVLVGTVFALKNNAGFGRSAMKSAKAGAPMAAESVTAGAADAGAAASYDMAKLEDAGILESKAEIASAAASASAGGNAAMAAPDAAKEAADRPENSLEEPTNFGADSIEMDAWYPSVMVNGSIYRFTSFCNDGLPEGCEYYGEVIHLKGTTPEEATPQTDGKLAYAPLYQVEGKIYTLPGNADVIYLQLQITEDQVRDVVIRFDRRS